MKKIVNLILLLSLMAIQAFSQIPSGSLFSRYAIGDLDYTGSAFCNAMGGVSAGLRFNNQINYHNPASYSAQDTLSFLFHFGLNGSSRTMLSSESSHRFNHANIGDLAISFPINRWLAASAGLTPYSKAGHDLLLDNTIQGTHLGTKIRLIGSGGINRFYIGTSVRIGQYVAIGANLNYLFGSIKNEISIALYDYDSNRLVEGSVPSVNKRSYAVGGIMFSGGVQLMSPASKAVRVVAGISVDNKASLNGNYTSLDYPGSRRAIDTFRVDIPGHIEIPLYLRYGFSVIVNKKLLVAADYALQNWTGATFFGLRDSTTAASSVRIGIQYSPIGMTDQKRAPYWQRLMIRAGAFSENSYISINGSQLVNRGFTVGLGIPLKNEKNMITNSSFNISYTHGSRGEIEKTYIRENYHLFSIGITLHDFWFIKSKYD